MCERGSYQGVLEMKTTNHARVARTVALLLATSLIASVAPAGAAIDGPRATRSFTSGLAEAMPLEATEKVPVTATRPAKVEQVTPRVQVKVDPAPASVSVSGQATTANSTPVKATGTASSTSSLARARAILTDRIARFPILRGTTVEFGDARGYQAIALYKSGRIIISPTHTASLERIIDHEIWHIIDWRDNGSIDWGENVPPADWKQYMN